MLHRKLRYGEGGLLRREVRERPPFTFFHQICLVVKPTLGLRLVVARSISARGDFRNVWNCRDSRNGPGRRLDR